MLICFHYNVSRSLTIPRSVHVQPDTIEDNNCSMVHCKVAVATLLHVGMTQKQDGG